MKQLILILWIGMGIAGCTAGRAMQQPAQPMVYALNATALEFNKGRVKNQDQVIMRGYQQLLKDADKALQFGPVSVMEKTIIPPSGNKHDYMSLAPYHWPDPAKPNGIPYLRKDGQTNPEVKEYKDKEYMPKLCSEVHTLGLAYYFSGEEKYATHASTLLRVWFLDTATRMNPNLDFAQAIKGVNTGRGAGLIDSRHFVKLIDGIGLLQGSQRWTVTDLQGMKKWFADYLNWMQTSKTGMDEMKAKNNHGIWYDAQRLSMALFIGDKVQASTFVLNAADRLDKQMDENGYFPKEMERTKSLHYTCFAMEAFFTVAQMAQKTSVDLWTLTTPTGKSLKKGMDVLRPYIAKEKSWVGPQIDVFDDAEAYPLLMDAALHFNCKQCKDDVKKLAGDKAAGLRLNLLYQ